jgi:hypothetical protein
MVKLLLQVLIIHQTFFLLPHILLSIHYVYHYIIFMLIIFALQIIYITQLLDRKMLKSDSFLISKENNNNCLVLEI